MLEFRLKSNPTEHQEFVGDVVRRMVVECNTVRQVQARLDAWKAKGIFVTAPTLSNCDVYWGSDFLGSLYGTEEGAIEEYADDVMGHLARMSRELYNKYGAGAVCAWGEKISLNVGYCTLCEMDVPILKETFADGTKTKVCAVCWSAMPPSRSEGEGDQEVRITASVPMNLPRGVVVDALDCIGVTVMKYEEERHIYGNAEEGDLPWTNS